MAPGGEMFRYSQHFGENGLLYGSHEWLPYSKDEVRLKTVNNNLSPSGISNILHHNRKNPGNTMVTKEARMHRMKKQTFAAVFLLGMILGCQGEFAALFGSDSREPLKVFPYRVAAFPPAD